MFSVIIPVFNHAPYLDTAVASALRSQRVSEVLLVDDGSEDGSADAIARLARQYSGRVRDLSRPGEGNLGAPARLNQLIERAGEEWVAVLNSDDAFVSGRFELLARRLARTEHEFVFGYLVIINEAGRPVGTKRGMLEPEYPFPKGFRESEAVLGGEISPALANQNFIATTSNLVFRKRLSERVGGFSDFRYVHDWDFALRASIQAPGLCLPHFLSLYRDHGSNTIKAPSEEVRSEVQAMFKRLLNDFPELRKQSRVVEALRGNPYLADSGLFPEESESLC